MRHSCKNTIQAIYQCKSKLCVKGVEQSEDNEADDAKADRPKGERTSSRNPFSHVYN